MLLHTNTLFESSHFSKAVPFIISKPTTLGPYIPLEYTLFSRAENMALALIVIDLQNDFLSPDGLLKKKHIPIEPLLSHLENVCAVFKEENWPIIAVRSEYPEAN
jgi:hypothetical protein